ncbi:OPT superfamily oligopeptide transporter [Rhizoclosmatium globosum]|uniref:OPT superfamily oligopeptide transporter n=1 Tax=Rhizoclosmatium globosum TaxID=329046 RepID=A0A1Y2AH58_9FUNG|nr:OPT superfamily oligopeptide transporter [Rhizoclosmatium globosum]|eukprot:ORY21846.1 OPT superfamily oligopeptide transporter [Rhizoclosmatium globosum]
MTKTADIVADKEHQLEDLKHEHPELEEDVEVEDIKEVEERIDFIVPQTDDPNTPAFTFRSVLLGSLWVVLLSFGNTALSFRTTPFTVGANIALILSYPMGLFLSAILPTGVLNPGPFSLKEHVLIYIMASCGSVPYGIDNVVAQIMPDLMGNTDITFFSALGFVLVTQFLGYGLSGLTRRFLVRPTAMWWPGNLSIIALFTSFHKVDTGDVDTSKERYTMSRYKVFWIAFAAMFVYEWLPQYFAPTLQGISLLCLIAGKGSGDDGVLSPFNAVAGSIYNGVGVLGITFDWTYFGSYVFTSPFWALMVNFGGTIILQWIVAPLLYQNDVWGLNQIISEDGQNPLLNTPHLFVGNANGTKKQGTHVSPKYFYDKTKNYDLNITAYNDVAPIHITSYFALVYGSSFLTITAAISHVGLWYGKDIYRQSMNAFRQIRDEVDSLDKHVKLMEAYPDVPDWAYLAFLAVSTVGALLVSIFTPFNMPWWGIFFNIFLCAIFILPFGIVPAISGFGLYLNVLTEFVIGLMIPGQTVAVMAFNPYLDSRLEAWSVPPHSTIRHGFAQFWGTLLNAIVSTAASWFMMFSSGNLLQDPNWRYNGYQTFYSAGGIWGAIGPQRFFGIGSVYQSLLWCFFVGFASPFLPWLANKYIYKSKYWHYINFSILYTIGSAGYPQVFIVVPVILSFVAQYLFLRNKEFYQKYLYVIGAAFDGAGGFVSLIVSLLFFGNISPPNWLLNPTPDANGDWYCYPGGDWNTP